MAAARAGRSRMERRRRVYRLVGIVVAAAMLLSTVGIGLGQLLFG